MALNEQQQRALEHARDFTAKAPRWPSPATVDEWYQAARRAVAGVATAFPPGYVEQPPPDAGDSDDPPRLSRDLSGDLDAIPPNQIGGE